MAREALGQERFPGAEKIVLITHRRRHVKITHTFEIFLFVCLYLSQILRVLPRALAPGLRSGVRDLKLAVLRYVLTCQVCPAIHGTQRRSMSLPTEKPWLSQATRANQAWAARAQASLPRPLLLLPSPPQRLLDCFSGRNVLEQVSKEPPFRQIPSLPASSNLNGPN